MASSLQVSGQTVSQYLTSLYEQYGHFVNLNSYWISRDPSLTKRIFDAIRTSGPNGNYGNTLGPWKISSMKDITLGYDSTESDKKLRSLPIDASGQMLSFVLDTTVEGGASEEGIDGLIGTIRSSGTEPKIKAYLEGWGSDKEKVGMALQRVWDALAMEWMKVNENGLESA